MLKLLTLFLYGSQALSMRSIQNRSYDILSFDKECNEAQDYNCRLIKTLYIETMAFSVNVTAKDELLGMIGQRLRDNIHSRIVQSNVAKTLTGLANLGTFIGGVRPYCRDQQNKSYSLLSNGLLCHILGITGLLTTDYAILSRESGYNLYGMTEDILNHPKIYYDASPNGRGFNFTKVSQAAASNGLQISSIYFSWMDMQNGAFIVGNPVFKYSIDGVNVFEHKVTKNGILKSIDRDYLDKALSKISSSLLDATDRYRRIGSGDLSI